MRPDLCTSLLPDAAQLRLETLDMDEEKITLQMTSLQPTPMCPDCGCVAQRTHSRYRRTLADLPWADKSAHIDLQVRRFFCDQPVCPRKTFAERLPHLAAPYARRTQRLTAAQQDVGLALGGAAGARLTAKQHMPASRNTMLRLIRHVPTSAARQPRIIGIDDWAQRKGHSYGTIIVDLEQQKPIDLLSDRLAETVEHWLRAHPGVEVISRDRAGAYASGATAGAPDAVQVADRWHLLKNLRETVEEELTQRAAQICRTEAVDTPDTDAPKQMPAMSSDCGANSKYPRTSQAATGVPATIPGSHTPVPKASPQLAIYPDTTSGRRAEATRQARRKERLHQYTQVVTLREQGLAQATIARRVGISNRTVTRWLAADGFPERKRRHGDTSILEPYLPFVLEQWQAGCHNATHLWRTLKTQGFPGSYSVVAGYLAHLRRGEAMPKRAADLPDPPTSTTIQPYFTARQAAFLFLSRSEDLTENEQRDIAQMEDAVLASLYTLTQAFTCIVRERQAERLDEWLQNASTSDFPTLHTFANSILRDYAAVHAALELPWSQGQVEGQITRLKLLKRQMYGRANLDLLRQRVLYAH